MFGIHSRLNERLKSLEVTNSAHTQKLEALERRITSHGVEIDELNLWRHTQDERDKWHDRRFDAIERKIDQLAEEVAKLTQHPADSWNKAVWVIISTGLASCVTYIATRLMH